MSKHNIPFSIYKKRKSPETISNLQLWDFFQGTQERVQNSRTEVLLYFRCFTFFGTKGVKCRESGETADGTE